MRPFPPRSLQIATVAVASLVMSCSTTGESSSAEAPAARHICLHESPSIPFVVGDTSTLQVGPADDKDSLCLPKPAGGPKWKSSRAGVASVDARGFLQALSPGTTVISVAHENTSDSATFTVLPPIRDIRIVPDSVTLSIGDSATFRIVAVGGAPSVPVWWYSADPVVSFGNPSSRAPIPVSMTGESVTVWAAQPGAALLEAGTRYLRDAAHVRVVVR